MAHAGTMAAATSIPYTFTARRSVAAVSADRRRFALIGVGGNGTRTAPVGQHFVDLVALCDVDSSHLADGNAMLGDGKADLYSDYREVLSRDDIDIVQISTPDHWHIKILVEAMTWCLSSNRLSCSTYKTTPLKK